MINNNLDDILKKRRITQEAIATKIGINRSQMNRIINCKCVPSLRTAMDIASFLNIKVEDIWSKPATQGKA